MSAKRSNGYLIEFKCYRPAAVDGQFSVQMPKIQVDLKFLDHKILHEATIANRGQ
jgi:hypothetical protein